MDEQGEIKQRVCRACNASYNYPEPKSAATRFYCASCADLPANVRASFEAMNKRIKALSAAVEKLEKRGEGKEGAGKA